MSEPQRLIVVGGVAGGASAAARARRLSEKDEIILFERGPEISYANCGLPYHIGGVIPERRRLLVQTAEGMRRRFRIDVRVQTEILRIDRQAKTVLAREAATGREYTERYDRLILSPGADPVRPPLAGIDSEKIFTLRTLADMDRILGALGHPPEAKVVIVGGGYIGLEMAEALRRRQASVVLVEMEPQVMSSLDPEMTTAIHEQLALHGVELKLRTRVTGFAENGGGLAVQMESGGTLECDFALLAMGVKPDVGLARAAGLELGPLGGIRVDAHLRSSDPDIWAVGDAAETEDWVTGRPALVPLAGPANRQGRLAADNAAGRDQAYRRTQGTAICKIFDVTAGSTGVNEKSLKKAGTPYEKIYVHPADHATYYPGAHALRLKLLFDPQQGRLLGAQAVGRAGVDKRLDVLAVALRARMTVFDLENLELAYAPPYGSAKDAVNYAGFVAANVLRGDVRICHVEDVLRRGPDTLLLDVRSRAEVKQAPVPGAVNIPIDHLRGRLEELPRDRDIQVICHVGMRAYLACRILSQHGFSCCNVSGGFRTYQDVAGIMAPREETEQEALEDTGEKQVVPE